MAATRCSQCGSDQLSWKTELRTMHTDVQCCARCGHEMAEEDWHAPTAPLGVQRCINCGDRLKGSVCVSCELSREESVQVHQELAQLMGKHELYAAARAAASEGRKVLALKLATAGAAYSHGAEREAARALRVWLLQTLGMSARALEDARRWVEDSPDPSAVAWASLGQQLERAHNPGAAADAYTRSLLRREDQQVIRARRAALLVQLQREGQANADVCHILELERDKADERAVQIAVKVADRLCEKLHARGEEAELQRLLDLAGDRARNSPTLLGYQALVFAQQGKDGKARKALRRARALHKELPVYELVTEALGRSRSGWWRW